MATDTPKEPLTAIPFVPGQQEPAPSIHLLITRDEDGIDSVIALNLPGAGSCGDSEDEALANAREALRGVLDSYREAGESIPWTDSRAAVIPPGATQKWIVLHA